MTRRFSMILMVLLGTAFPAGAADEAAKPGTPIVEIYEIPIDWENSDEDPSPEDIRKHGKRLFSDADISDLKPVEGFEGRFTVEVTASGREQFVKTVYGEKEGQLFMVINGMTRAETLHACAGCQVIDGAFSPEELQQIRDKLLRRPQAKKQPEDKQEK